ncbi:MAG: ABC transporter ATP-binding protein [Actinomycetota bacterium]|nr:ABC transporter ATP-binding protein [Actinomycetota bacterium]
MPGNDPVVKVTNLTRRFKDLVAVDGVSFDIASGEIFGLLGPNGAGKTTTVLMLATLLRPTSGEAFVAGLDAFRRPKEVRRRISYVPQGMAVDFALTGRDNLDYYASLFRIRGRDKIARIDQVIEFLGLESVIDQRVQFFSGGMRRRLELAQAMLTRPKVLFLDEPTLGLDVAARRRLWELIGNMTSDGIACLLTTHYMDEAEALCNRVAFISHGKIARCGTPSDLVAEIGGEAIQIDLCRPLFSDSVMKDVARVADVSVEGLRLTLVANGGRHALPKIAGILHSHDVEVESISIRRPKLEDVYLECVDGSQELVSASEGAELKRMARRSMS